MKALVGTVAWDSIGDIHENTLASRRIAGRILTWIRWLRTVGRHLSNTVSIVACAIVHAQIALASMSIGDICNCALTAGDVAG